MDPRKIPPEAKSHPHDAQIARRIARIDRLRLRQTMKQADLGLRMQGVAAYAFSAVVSLARRIYSEVDLGRPPGEWPHGLSWCDLSREVQGIFIEMACDEASVFVGELLTDAIAPDDFVEVLKLADDASYKSRFGVVRDDHLYEACKQRKQRLIEQWRRKSARAKVKVKEKTK